MLRRRNFCSPTVKRSSSSSLPTMMMTLAAPTATSSFRYILPGTDNGVIKSPYPSVMDKINAEKSLWEQYTACAKKYSNQTAYVCGVSGRTRTYKEAFERTMRYAQIMQHGMNIVEGDVVVVLSPNTLDYPSIFYAAMAIGATVCPVNPMCTAEELQRTVAAAGRVKAIFTLDTFKATVATALGLMQATKSSEMNVNLSKKQGHDVMPQTFLYGDTLELPDTFPDFKQIIHKREDTAILPFSSGTTGIPKGVQLTNYNVISNIFQSSTAMGIRESDETFMSVLPFFHIYGMVVCMMIGWVKGAKQIVLPKFDLENYMKLCAQHKPTQLFVAPPMFLAFLKAPFPNKKEVFAPVRRIISGAAPLGENLQKNAAELFSDNCVISQGYGMSEASPVVTTSCPACPTSRPELKTYGHVGAAVSDTEMRVVDPETGKDVDEFGQPGEFWIRGPQIMKGYLREVDNEKVFENGEGGRWYKSGDIGVVNKDYTFTITDRVKELIKYSGYQVAPAELEAHLQHHDKVSEAIVVGLPTTDGSGDELPYAQVALKHDVAAEVGDDAAKKAAIAEELKNYVKEHLSHYKQLRGGLDIVAAVPKSPTGKLLRRIARDEKIKQMKK